MPRGQTIRKNKLYVLKMKININLEMHVFLRSAINPICSKKHSSSLPLLSLTRRVGTSLLFGALDSDIRVLKV